MTLNSSQRSDLIKGLEAKRALEEAESRLAATLSDMSFAVATEYQRLTGMTVKNHDTCKYWNQGAEESPCDNCQSFESWESRQ